MSKYQWINTKEEYIEVLEKKRKCAKNDGKAL